MVIYLAAFTCGAYIAWILATIVHMAEEESLRVELAAQQRALYQPQEMNQLLKLEIDCRMKQLVILYQDLDARDKEIEDLTRKLALMDYFL